MLMQAMSRDDHVITLVRRCAWCDRVWTRHGWKAHQQAPEPQSEHESGTICTTCADALRDANLSR